MILSNLLSRINYWLKSEEQRLEDRVLLEGLQVEDKLDEALAYAYVLSSIAGVDGTFDHAERSLVGKIMLEVFPDRSRDVPDLISSAESMLANFRTSESYVNRIKEEYSEEERLKLYDAIDRVIASDGLEGDAEKFIRERFRKALL